VLSVLQQQHVGGNIGDVRTLNGDFHRHPFLIQVRRSLRSDVSPTTVEITLPYSPTRPARHPPVKGQLDDFLRGPEKSRTEDTALLFSVVHWQTSHVIDHPRRGQLTALDDRLKRRKESAQVVSASLALAKKLTAIEERCIRRRRAARRTC
jgi:hypothetical protein